MRKKLLTIFIILFSLTGCSLGADPKDHLPETYIIALDALMKEDDALNSDMKYISIDMSNFENFTEKDKKKILKFFEDNYQVKVMDASLDELKKKGLFNADNMSLEGVLLRIEKVDYKLVNNIRFVGSKYRSGLGAIGLEITVHEVDGEWEVKKSKLTWIS
ncbi:hypothetical protein JOC86_000262 [Bacillus pakistanensis]|uniref:Peptide ABC transporter substrate-binding protein n=1 Tax=Rossellomorea pakistanensis TaxID=992288 RepID=A0ABS2N7E7_9BACI|nr:peptide ABC transporter substrate-binding protein [Bacillus pakistanensis]MBM7583725.1 hypothetical protein [Bacillus pakistanensis]